MQSNPLAKYLVLSVVSFCIGTLHGMLQVLPSVRKWLDSIGSPYGGPGHMIDPLAHAHMNLVGGVVLLAMGTTYYLLPVMTGRVIHSIRMMNQTFWWTSIGAYGFYVTKLGGNGDAYQAGLAAVGITLMTLWLFSIALLLGAQLNCVLAGSLRRRDAWQATGGSSSPRTSPKPRTARKTPRSSWRRSSAPR